MRAGTIAVGLLTAAVLAAGRPTRAESGAAATLAAAEASWKAGRHVAAGDGVRQVFEEATHALVEQARSCLPSPTEGWSEEPVDPDDPLYRSAADALRHGAFTVSRALRKSGAGRVIVAFRRLDDYEAEIEEDVWSQVRVAGKAVTERGRPAWKEEWTAGRRMLHLRLAPPRTWVDVAVDADVSDADLAALVARLRLDEMEAVTAPDPSPPAAPYDPAVLFARTAEALSAGRYAWVLGRAQALHHGIHMTRWRRVVAALPPLREGWTSEEPPLVPGQLYPPTILARRYLKEGEAEAWIVLNSRPEMLEAQRRGLASLGSEGDSRIVEFRGRKAIRVTNPPNDNESLAVLVADGTVALVVSISPLARRELLEPFLADLDLAAIEKAWRESG